MEQNQPLNPPYPPAPGLTVGNALNIAVETREGLWVADTATGHGAPKPSSALGKIYAYLQQALTALGTIASGITELKAMVGSIQAGQVSPEALKLALSDPEVLALFVNAINDDAARRAAE